MPSPTAWVCLHSNQESRCAASPRVWRRRRRHALTLMMLRLMHLRAVWSAWLRFCHNVYYLSALPLS